MSTQILMSTPIFITSIILVLFCLVITIFYVWWHFNVKRPEDKRMKEECKWIQEQRNKYQSEIRNF